MSDDVITAELPKPDLGTPTPASSTSTASGAVNGQLVETSATTVKPGYKTSEFYLGLAAVLLSTLFAGGVFTSNTALSIAGMAASVLTALGYKVSRTVVKTAAVKAMAVMLLIGVVACGASQRRTTIGAALATIDATAIAVPTYAHQHTEDMIAAARKNSTPVPQVSAEVETFRASVDKTTLAVDGLYRLVAVAALANDDISVANLLKAIVAVQAQIKELEK